MQVENVLSMIEAETAKKIAAAWSGYRALLIKSNAGKLTEADGVRLAELIGNLGHAPDLVREHARALANDAAIGVKKTRLEENRAKLNKLNPKLNEVAERRARIIASLDAELNPLLQESQELERLIFGDDAFVGMNEGREAGRYPELFGVVPPKAPAPITPDEEAEVRARALYYAAMLSAAAFIIDTGAKRENFDAHVNEALNYGVKFGWIVRDKPLTAELIARGGPDPRQASAENLATEMRKQNIAPAALGKSGKALWETGVRWGWIKGTDLLAGAAD